LSAARHFKQQTQELQKQAITVESEAVPRGLENVKMVQTLWASLVTNNRHIHCCS